MTNKGLTNDEIKQFTDLILKANDFQISKLSEYLQHEQKRRMAISHQKQLEKETIFSK